MVAPGFLKCLWTTQRGFLAVALVVMAGGCDGNAESPPPVAPSPSQVVDELALHDGRACPERLPEARDPNKYGFGTDEPATALPAVPVPDQGWVCLYNPVDVSRRSDNGAFFRWVRHGGAHKVPHEDLLALSSAVDELDLRARHQMCTADLGPRWMLVLSHQGDLTGVVVDDYGCRDVRLTDEPFDIAPGDAGPVGTVPGVLATPGWDLLKGIQAAFDQ